MTTRTMIEAEGLHKHFGSTHALRGLDLDAREGTVLVVLGPNGAGKTTAVRILTTLTRANEGRASVAGTRRLPTYLREQRVRPDRDDARLAPDLRG